jgi:hypothetical protein
MTLYATKLGTQDCSSLRHQATNREVMKSIPDEFTRLLNWPNPSSCTMALGSTQPLKKIHIRNLPGDKGWCVCVRITTSLSSVSWLARKCGSFDVSLPYGPLRPVTGIALSLPYMQPKNYNMWDSVTLVREPERQTVLIWKPMTGHYAETFPISSYCSTKAILIWCWE